MELKEILFSLSSAFGVSGRENSLSELVSRLIEPYCDSVEIDKLGNVIAVKKGTSKNAKTLMFDGHLDEIGMMVTGITKEGFIRFADITGVDKRTLLASEVIIHGRKDVYGVVSCQPPHLQTEEEAKKTVSLDKLVIDIGFSEEKAKELVSVGDVISQKSKCIELMNDQVSGKAFDDRAAVSAIIKAFENLQKTQLPYNLVMVASAQEETGCRGARTATYRVAPDEAIALDVSFAYTPDASKEDTGELNKGPMISYAATIKRELFKSLQTIAKAKKIPYQLEIMSATSGTNTDKIQLSRDGVAAGLISIPLKYMHTGIETLSLKDLENTAKLLTAYALSKKEEWADA